MGRQIQICTTDSDNAKFESYLSSTFNCIFLQSSAPSADDIIISSFDKTSYPFSRQIFIWNTAFRWNVELKQDETKDKKYYISNTSNAPLIEFSKTDWVTNNHGRLYWSKYFTAGPIEYDVGEFERFYDTIVKWFTKNAQGKVKWAGVNVYYLEDAWNRYSPRNGR